MALAQVASRALFGLEAPAVQVEVHLAGGLPGFSMVGLPETEVREARERVRSALLNSGLEFPCSRRIVVNLAPADLPKESGRFDLPIALGLLAATGVLKPAALAGHEFAGELSLSGELRPVRGALAMACAALQDGEQGRTPRIVLPRRSAVDAALAAPETVLGATHLTEVIAYLSGQRDADSLRTPPPETLASAAAHPDLADVRGQAVARRALEIAAAGGHHILFIGPPGSGKSMLAQRLPGLLPALNRAQALQSASLLNLAGQFDPALHWGRPPLRSPHHGASAAALAGGGHAAALRPGEISLAHHGVLFLDEWPEFDRRALECLREPLESGRMHIARAGHRAEFPARFQLVAAMNPCPCGYLGDPRHACRCTPAQIARYRGRISGPLLDRMDLQVDVPALPAETLLAPAQAETSAAVAARVAAAADIQRQRQDLPNARLQGSALQHICELDAPLAAWFGAALQRLGWSARAAHRALKVARTIADLAGRPRIQAEDLAEAMQYRRALAA